MARGRKNYSLEEQIENIKTEIKNTENILNELKAEHERLIDEKKHKDAEELYLLMVQSGQTIDDMRELLKGVSA